jgi:hypothetical protein
MTDYKLNYFNGRGRAEHITWKNKFSRSSQLGLRWIISINLSLNI